MKPVRLEAMGLRVLALFIAGWSVPTAISMTAPYVQPLLPVDGAGFSITGEQAQYFTEIALGSEFSAAEPRIRKWQSNVRIQCFGNPTAEDLGALSTVIADVNRLTQGRINLQAVTEKPNLIVRFVPVFQFADYDPNYQPTNYGFFWARWEGDTITSANVLVSSSGITQKERSHLIREEITQALGLMRDSWRYSDSLFYQGWSDVNEYAEVDKQLIRLLYSSEIEPGMNQDQVKDVLKNLKEPKTP